MLSVTVNVAVPSFSPTVTSPIDTVAVSPSSLIVPTAWSSEKLTPRPPFCRFVRSTLNVSVLVSTVESARIATVMFFEVSPAAKGSVVVVTAV